MCRMKHRVSPWEQMSAILLCIICKSAVDAHAPPSNLDNMKTWPPSEIIVVQENQSAFCFRLCQIFPQRRIWMKSPQFCWFPLWGQNCTAATYEKMNSNQKTITSLKIHSHVHTVISVFIYYYISKVCVLWAAVITAPSLTYADHSLSFLFNHQVGGRSSFVLVQTLSLFDLSPSLTLTIFLPDPHDPVSDPSSSWKHLNTSLAGLW